MWQLPEGEVNKGQKVLLFLLVYFSDFGAEWQNSNMEDQGMLFPSTCYSLSVICVHTGTESSEAMCGTENETVYLIPDCVYSEVR